MITHPQNKPTLHNTESAARFIGVEPSTLPVWRCTRRYDLPYVKVGAKVYYDEADLLRFLELRKVGNGDR
jgi:Helix-turn-helix domain